MALAGLAEQLTSALSSVLNRNVVDKTAVAELVKIVTNSLLLADVQFELVLKLRHNIERKIVEERVFTGAPGRDKRFVPF